jgi:hypothetical protein
MGDHMFNDLTLSRDMMQEYLSKEAVDHPSRHLSVMVLQQSVWPFPARKKEADLPPSVSYSQYSENRALMICLTDAGSIDKLRGFLQSKT